MPSQTTEFESLLEAVPDAMVGVDKSGVIRFVNHRAESLFGYGRDDLVGMPVEKLVPESRRMVHKVHRQSYNAAPRARSMGSNLKLSGLRRDGTEFPVDISLSARDDADGLLVIAAVRDMTHSRLGEQDRRLDRLSAAVEFSGEAITSATLDGIITSWNPAAERPARELERLAELERFQRLTVGRELKMIELKKELEYLRKYGPHGGGEPGDQR